MIIRKFTIFFIQKLCRLLSHIVRNAVNSGRNSHRFASQNILSGMNNFSGLSGNTSSPVAIFDNELADFIADICHFSPHIAAQFDRRHHFKAKIFTSANPSSFIAAVKICTVVQLVKADFISLVNICRQKIYRCFINTGSQQGFCPLVSGDNQVAGNNNRFDNTKGFNRLAKCF